TLYLTSCELKNNSVNNDSVLRFGGAITNSGACYLNSCSLTGNSAPIGGGVYTTRALFVSDCKFSSNVASYHSNDIYSTNELHISISESFISLWGEEYAQWAWYDDKADSRFNAESNVTASHNLPLMIESETGSSHLTFALVQQISGTTPDEEDDTPATPSFPSNPRPPHSDSSVAPEKEKKTIALICGDALLDTTKTAYLLGYGDGTLGEEDSITRAQMAQIIYRLLAEESRALLDCETNDFYDVPFDAWYNAAVSAIAKSGVVQGCNGYYNPGDTLTRAELITILVRFSETKDGTSSFTDISGHWAESSINAAVFMGWIENGESFCPDIPATRSETIDLLNHIFEICNNGQA
ncbi:MAG: S-layer homology domain-containing protein, partial [Bacillota bacterium]